MEGKTENGRGLKAQKLKNYNSKLKRAMIEARAIQRRWKKQVYFSEIINSTR